MIIIKGKRVFGGVSIGKIMFYKRNEKVEATSKSVWEMMQKIVQKNITPGNIKDE